MQKAQSVPPPQANRLLGALPKGDLERLLPHLETVAKRTKDFLYDVDQPIQDIYFPLNGVASLLAQTGQDEYIEVATVGSEGMIGLPVFLGSLTAPTLSFWQVPGYGARMSTEVFQEELRRMPALHQIMHRYTQALMNQIAQGAACNRHHETLQRLARWLLMSQDRVGANTFPLTQEFIALMLGVRRATANEAAQQLQASGLIQYRRGIISIINRPGLEKVSCTCYRIITDNFDRLIPRNPTAEQNQAYPWGISGHLAE